MQHKDADRYERFFEVLARIAHLLASETEQKEVLAEVLEELYFKLGFSRGTVILFAPSGIDLFVQTPSANLSPWHRSLRYRPRDGVVGAAIQSRQPVIVARASEEPAVSGEVESPEDPGRETIDFVCVPIMLGDEAIGSLSGDLPDGLGDAVEEMLRFLKVAANLIASDVRTRRRPATGPVPARAGPNRDAPAPGDEPSRDFDSTQSAGLRDLQEEIWKLDDFIQHAVRSSSHEVEPDERSNLLRFRDLREAAREGPLKACVRLMERIMIMQAFQDTHGSMKRTAAQLGISGRMLHYKVKNLGIDRLWFVKRDDDLEND